MSTNGTQVRTLENQNAPAGHLVPSVSQMLTVLEPDRFPLTTMTARMPAGEKPINPVHGWEEEGPYQRLDLINGVVAAGAAGATKDIVVDTVNMWRVHDLIRIPTNLSAPSLIVESINEGTSTLTVRALAEVATGNASGFGTVPDIADNEPIFWAGNAKHTLSTPSDPRGVVPTAYNNFAEIHDAVIEIDATRKASKNFTNSQDWTRNQRRQLAEFRKSREIKFWFGKKSYTKAYGVNKERWTMNGATSYIDKKLSYYKNLVDQPKITETLIIDWLSDIFSGNNGSRERFMFVDRYLAAEIMKVDLVNLRSRELKRILGVICDRMEFNFGFVNIVYTPIFNVVGKNHYGVVLDMENIYQHDFLPMERNVLDYKGQGKHGEGEQYIEQTTVSVRNLETHAIVEGLNAPAEV